MHTILDEQNRAREAAESWQDRQADAGNEFPYLELDHKCDGCMYTCKQLWRFAGLVQRDGEPFTVGPNCPVLWVFSDWNPLRERFVGLTR